jgi:protease I
MNREDQSKCACPCSKGIDRRDFLKVTALAGLLAGCNPVIESDGPGKEPTASATIQPTLAPDQTRTFDLAGKKVVYILPKYVYALQCHASSSAILSAAGAQLVLAAPEKIEIGVWGGGTPALMPELVLTDVQAADFDAVIFECGQPLNTYDLECQRIAREAVAQNKVLGAICMMPALLAAAGLLKGVQAVSNPEDEYILEQYGAVILKTDAIRDGGIITANFNGHLQFGYLIAEALAE